VANTMPRHANDLVSGDLRRAVRVCDRLAFGVRLVDEDRDEGQCTTADAADDDDQRDDEQDDDNLDDTDADDDERADPVDDHA
jgi:hypothetical protein